MAMRTYKYEHDNPKFSRVVDLLHRASQTGSGYGIDTSDCDVALLHEETFERIDALEAKLEAMPTVPELLDTAILLENEAETEGPDFAAILKKRASKLRSLAAAQ